MLLWNIGIWLDVPSHVTSFNQSESFISAYHCCATQKFGYDISPWLSHLDGSSEESSTARARPTAVVNVMAGFVAADRATLWRLLRIDPGSSSGFLFRNRFGDVIALRDGGVGGGGRHEPELLKRRHERRREREQHRRWRHRRWRIQWRRHRRWRIRSRRVRSRWRTGCIRPKLWRRKVRDVKVDVEDGRVVQQLVVVHPENRSIEFSETRTTTS